MKAQNEHVQPAIRIHEAVDLSEYAKHILAHEDHPLFDEAVAVAEVGALRSAYVMIWLACAESLKRRFREAQLRDNAAGKIAGEIDTMERQHRAVDKFLLEKAQEYGFVSDSGRVVLNQIYEMRCIYAHPYEQAPSREKVTDAAASVVDLVLSKPVRLRHGFGKQLLNSLLEDRSYLDDQESAVADFTKSIVARLDESVHRWLLDRYWEELEKLSDDSSMAIFFRRGTWFCRTMLAEVGVATLTHDQWHDRSRRFPKTLISVCGIADIFRAIGELAQNSLVGSAFEESKTRASVLVHLEGLYNDGVLSERQSARFFQQVSDLKTSTMLASGLSTKTCYPNLIEALRSYNWYVQNPAIDTVMSNGAEQVAELTEEQRITLGRNILQAGQGTAASAIEFLEKLSQDATGWPFDVVRGIALESFTNESNEIRFKDRYLDLVLSTLVHIDEIRRGELITQIAESIAAGTPQGWVDRRKIDPVTASLRTYTWAEPLVEILEAKFPAELPEES